MERYSVGEMKLSCCINCDGGKKNGGNCVQPDESALLMDKIFAADAVIFGSPVYWWGISAQLKMAVDKMYSKSEILRGQKKKIGLLAVGAGALDDPQYRLIREQFECICGFFGWELIFSEFICAHNATDLAGDVERLEHLRQIWKKLV